MKEQLNKGAVGKGGIKKSMQKSVSKTKGRGGNAQHKKGSKGGKEIIDLAIIGLSELSEPSLSYSYKLADDKNVLAIIDAVRTGIPIRQFEKIVSATPFSLTEWANYLQVSNRTIQRNQSEGKRFQPVQSERIIDLVMLYQYGVEVFGDKVNFNIWLSSKSVALGGRIPKDLLDTTFGIGMVKDELGRIEHGVLA